jgi:hypothetical protein
VITETYKGCRIRAVKGKGWEWGRTRVVLNGVDKGHYGGDEPTVVASIKATIDDAERMGVAEARFGPEWFAPGTYDLCPEGHEMPIGGQCGHHWCAAHRIGGTS